MGGKEPVPEGRKENTMRFTILAGDRKEVRAKLEELTGERAVYTRMPRCAFILRGIAVEKNGEVTTEEGADMELVRKLIEAGLISDAVEEAERLGYHPYILSTAMEGDAANLGIFFAGLTNEICRTGRPFKAPCALISAGETTVTIHGSCGKGGPNQETALAYPTKLYVPDNVVCLSVDSDGTDGPSDIAGGISDGLTRQRAKDMGINLTDVLNRHDSSTALLQLDDAIITGHTGTNIMNFRVVVIDGKEE